MTSARQPLLYAPLADLVTNKLAAGGFTPLVSPGPVDANTLKSTPDDMVFLMLGAGAGLSTDGIYDRVIITTRTVGGQNDYDQAEALALALDLILLGIEIPISIGQARSLYITRTGGRPTLLLRDESDRYHHTCSYITEATSGL